MERLYKSRSLDDQAKIDALVASASARQMSEACRIRDAVVHGYCFDFEAADPKSLEIAHAFLENA